MKLMTAATPHPVCLRKHSPHHFRPLLLKTKREAVTEKRSRGVMPSHRQKQRREARLSISRGNTNVLFHDNPIFPNRTYLLHRASPPIASALIILFYLFAHNRLMSGLAFASAMIATVVGVRALGALMDGDTASSDPAHATSHRQPVHRSKDTG
jgi:hypothetical protein